MRSPSWKRARIARGKRQERMGVTGHALGMPALVITIDEYAELADEAPEAMSDTDSIARLGRP